MPDSILITPDNPEPKPKKPPTMAEATSRIADAAERGSMGLGSLSRWGNASAMAAFVGLAVTGFYFIMDSAREDRQMFREELRQTRTDQREMSKQMADALGGVKGAIEINTVEVKRIGANARLDAKKGGGEECPEKDP